MPSAAGGMGLVHRWWLAWSRDKGLEVAIHRVGLGQSADNNVAKSEQPSALGFVVGLWHNAPGPTPTKKRNNKKKG